MVKEMKDEVVSLSWANEAFCMKISAEKKPAFILSTVDVV